MTAAERIQRINAEISGVAAQYGITSWERQFLASVGARRSLSAKQEAILEKIEEKVFGADGPGIYRGWFA